MTWFKKLIDFDFYRYLKWLIRILASSVVFHLSFHFWHDFESNNYYVGLIIWTFANEQWWSRICGLKSFESFHFYPCIDSKWLMTCELIVILSSVFSTLYKLWFYCQIKNMAQEGNILHLSKRLAIPCWDYAIHLPWMVFQYWEPIHTVN